MYEAAAGAGVRAVLLAYWGTTYAVVHWLGKPSGRAAGPGRRTPGTAVPTGHRIP
ncbi:hypothetical protein [Streptomyces kasugaensis]|uniref:hypothetical protein n=1 Tax=Streptomyces kasugaensis TaxID=1946 RepID=UPI0013EFAB9B|nr:hypothetical protein [Streptomyces kasugaensis]